MNTVWTSYPLSSGLVGSLQVPGDKSISHRALILGAIAEKSITIHGINAGEDCQRTMHGLEQMGVQFQQTSKSKITIQGVGLYGLKAPFKPIECGNSGSTMRFFMGLLAGQPFDSILVGDESLNRRPMARVAEPLSLMGASIILSKQGHAPITIKGTPNLQGIEYRLSIPSAQVKTALMLAALYAKTPSNLTESIQTRDHTEKLLMWLTSNSDHELSENRTEISIPGDISAAAFFMVAACIIPDSDIYLTGVNINSTRLGVVYILRQMGAQITFENLRWMGYEPVADIRIQYAPLNGITIPENYVVSAIDEFPVLFIAAAVAKGKTILRHADELRHKESDRITVMAAGLRKLGIEVEMIDSGLMINGGRIQGGCVDSAGDHRVAMAFAIAGAVSAGPIEIFNCNCVNTSFPEFLTCATALNVRIESI